MMGRCLIPHCIASALIVGVLLGVVSVGTLAQTGNDACCEVTEAEILEGCVQATSGTDGLLWCGLSEEIFAVCPCSCCRATFAPTSTPTAVPTGLTTVSPTTAPTQAPTIETCRCAFDIMFLLDASASIGSDRFYGEVLDFVESVSRRFRAGPDSSETRIGVATFARPSGAVVGIPLSTAFKNSDFITNLRSVVDYTDGLSFIAGALEDVFDHFNENPRPDSQAVERVVIHVLDAAFSESLRNWTYNQTDSTIFDISNRFRDAGIIQFVTRLPGRDVPSRFSEAFLSRAARILSQDPQIPIPGDEFLFQPSGSLLDVASNVSTRICEYAFTDGTCKPTSSPTMSPTQSPMPCPPGSYRLSAATRQYLQLDTYGGECPDCQPCKYDSCGTGFAQYGSCGANEARNEETEDCRDAFDLEYCRSFVCGGHCTDSSPFFPLSIRCLRSCGICTGENNQTCDLVGD